MTKQDDLLLKKLRFKKDRSNPNIIYIKFKHPFLQKLEITICDNDIQVFCGDLFESPPGSYVHESVAEIYRVKYSRKNLKKILKWLMQ